MTTQTENKPPAAGQKQPSSPEFKAGFSDGFPAGYREGMEYERGFARGYAKGFRKGLDQAERERVKAANGAKPES